MLRKSKDSLNKVQLKGRPVPEQLSGSCHRVCLPALLSSHEPMCYLSKTTIKILDLRCYFEVLLHEDHVYAQKYVKSEIQKYDICSGFYCSFLLPNAFSLLPGFVSLFTGGPVI